MNPKSTTTLLIVLAIVIAMTSAQFTSRFRSNTGLHNPHPHSPNLNPGTHQPATTPTRPVTPPNSPTTTTATTTPTTTTTPTPATSAPISPNDHINNIIQNQHRLADGTATHFNGQTLPIVPGINDIARNQYLPHRQTNLDFVNNSVNNNAPINTNVSHSSTNPNVAPPVNPTTTQPVNRPVTQPAQPVTQPHPTQPTPAANNALPNDYVQLQAFRTRQGTICYKCPPNANQRACWISPHRQILRSALNKPTIAMSPPCP